MWAARSRDAVVPRGAPRGRRPLLVLLHWRGGSPDRLLSGRLFAALARLGPRAPAVAAAERRRQQLLPRPPRAAAGRSTSCARRSRPRCAGSAPTRGGWPSAAPRWAASARSTSPGCGPGASAPWAALAGDLRLRARHDGGLVRRRRADFAAGTTCCPSIRPTAARRSGSTWARGTASAPRTCGWRASWACTAARLARRARQPLLARAHGRLSELLRGRSGALLSRLAAAVRSRSVSASTLGGRANGTRNRSDRHDRGGGRLRRRRLAEGQGAGGRRAHGGRASPLRQARRGPAPLRPRRVDRDGEQVVLDRHRRALGAVPQPPRGRAAAPPPTSTPRRTRACPTTSR